MNHILCSVVLILFLSYVAVCPVAASNGVNDDIERANVEKELLRCANVFGDDGHLKLPAILQVEFMVAWHHLVQYVGNHYDMNTGEGRMGYMEYMADKEIVLHSIQDKIASLNILYGKNPEAYRSIVKENISSYMALSNELFVKDPELTTIYEMELSQSYDAARKLNDACAVFGSHCNTDDYQMLGTDLKNVANSLSISEGLALTRFEPSRNNYPAEEKLGVPLNQRPKQVYNPFTERSEVVTYDTSKEVWTKDETERYTELQYKIERAHTEYVQDLTFEIAVIVIAAAILGYTIVAVYSLGVCYKEISSTAPELRYGVTTMVTDTWHEFSYPALVLVLIVIASACAALAGAIYGLVNTIEKHKEEIKDIEEMKKMVKEHGFTVPDGTDASVWV
ncbi:MAG: hypothetical protein O0X93_08725 [Methanocorpusculum sp.]|nr:hypothetical protein [Methanocorpusculum sp.]